MDWFRAVFLIISDRVWFQELYSRTFSSWFSSTHLRVQKWYSRDQDWGIVFVWTWAAAGDRIRCRLKVWCCVSFLGSGRGHWWRNRKRVSPHCPLKHKWKERKRRSGVTLMFSQSPFEESLFARWPPGSCVPIHILILRPTRRDCKSQEECVAEDNQA